MKIIVSQQNKRINVIFKKGDIADNYYIDKADDFLTCVDKLLRRHVNLKDVVIKARFKFVNVGMLTETVIKAIIKGMSLNV